MKNQDYDKNPESEAQPGEQEGFEEVEAEELTTDIESLQAELDQLRNNVEETHNRYLRTLADFDNYRKRQREEISRHANLVREELILKLLPAIDNLERALASAEAQHSYESLVEGVSLTLRQMQEMMRKEGVEPIEAAGKEFNPEFHEAMMRVPTDDYPENTVIDELEKGYTLGGKVLRPARVRVATQD